MDQMDILSEAIKHAGRSVLATIIHVEGHAYRKEGATMLLHQDNRVGSLSPGCLEADLAEYVPSVLQKGAAEVVTYDMRPEDDLSWGENIGCGGMIRVLLEPVTGELLELLVQIVQKLEQGVKVRFVRKLSHSGIPEMYQVMTNVRTETDVKASESCFIVDYSPKPRLVIFGAGDDAQPVAEFALRVGFRVVVADWRSSLCTKIRFPNAELLYGFPSELIEFIKPSSEDYFILMSHQFIRDQEMMNALFDFNPRYAGILGSLSRTERMLEGREVPSWLHYPVGLPIGADGPDEIAFSIVSELILVRRKLRGSQNRRDWYESQCGRNLLGSGKEQPNGATETVDGVDLREKNWRIRS